MFRIKMVLILSLVYFLSITTTVAKTRGYTRILEIAHQEN